VPEIPLRRIIQQTDVGANFPLVESISLPALPCLHSPPFPLKCRRAGVPRLGDRKKSHRWVAFRVLHYPPPQLNATSTQGCQLCRSRAPRKVRRHISQLAMAHADRLNRVMAKLRTLPPLVTPSEVCMIAASEYKPNLTYPLID
jgi:hypothetical protein